jgi:hypothetical protein
MERRRQTARTIAALALIDALPSCDGDAPTSRGGTIADRNINIGGSLLTS